jgi:hypothetical protein
MGLMRKMMSVSSLGAVDFKSDKERTASYTKTSAKEAKKQSEEAHRQTAILERMAATSASHEAAPYVVSNSVVPPDTLAVDLRQLAELRDSGILTEAEFVEQKQRRLDKS